MPEPYSILHVEGGATIEQLAWGVFFFVLGACLGSFINVVIHRLPRGESIVYPPSHCPRCGHALSWWENVPLVSYLILRGRCRACHQTISPRYPLVELASALLLSSCYLSYGLSIRLLWSGVFTLSLLAVFFIDLDHQIIPDEIDLPGIVLGLVLSPWTIGFVPSLLGGLLGGGGFLLIGLVASRILRKEALGGGDVKLMAMIGTFLGPQGVLLTTFFGSFLGALVGTLWLKLSGRGRGTPIPFGPFLVTGAYVALFWGKEILQWYLTLGTG